MIFLDMGRDYYNREKLSRNAGSEVFWTNLRMLKDPLPLYPPHGGGQGEGVFNFFGSQGGI